MTSHQGMLSLALTLSTVVLLALPSLLYGEILHVRPTSTSTIDSVVQFNVRMLDAALRLVEFQINMIYKLVFKPSCLHS